MTAIGYSSKLGTESGLPSAGLLEWGGPNSEFEIPNSGILLFFFETEQQASVRDDSLAVA
jgi:hypothetical protein